MVPGPRVFWLSLHLSIICDVDGEGDVRMREAEPVGTGELEPGLAISLGVARLGVVA